MFFGWKMGLIEGLMVPLVSDIVLGLGFWTPFQMLSWGIIGFLSGFIPHNKWFYVFWLILTGFLYGFMMTFSYYIFVPNIKAIYFMWLSGLIFDLYHSFSNLLFGALSPILFKIFKKEAGLFFTQNSDGREDPR